MVTIVELISATDAITFYPTPDVNGWVYDNATLDAWYALADVNATPNKRPNAHGAYSLAQTFTEEHHPIVAGQRFGASIVDALASRRRLAAMYSDGKSLTMRVTDELGATSRTVWLVDYDAPFRYGFDHFPFDIALVAPDPRRYGPSSGASASMPAAGSGLIWNLGTSGSGLYFDWGTVGATGQVTMTNTGDATTYPRIEVGGGVSSFGAGFRLVEVETGRELTYSQGTVAGDVIAFDSRTQRATISAGGGDVTGFLSSRKWFSIPAGATRRYQITPLGSVTGSPTMTVYIAPAYL